MKNLEAREQQRRDEQEHAAEDDGHRPYSIGGAVAIVRIPETTQLA
jgi:hypothetical protein